MEYLSTIWLTKYFKPPFEAYYSERKKKKKGGKEKLLFQIQLLIDIQAGFRKGRGTRDQIPNIRWIVQKAREFQKNIYSCFIDYTKTFNHVESQHTVENS